MEHHSKVHGIEPRGVVSDQKYGTCGRADRRWCPRLFLHCHELGFENPETQEWVLHRSPLPSDLVPVLRLLDPVETPQPDSGNHDLTGPAQ
mmetsp:Transcript_79085/g.180969  ORF Transcript_79085/g.180969 Transcript_79085/m.180969 type:complete len:91 (-) Transcript_79085:47-319(-)